ncbi:probable glutamate--tRNA ligase, mitochondrial [Pollicipes pollicipes]|uniref:probable glutamate--tRNA ligase, mitochondrial n=1 Tax=Pollicipes pollicipes TaxID=41117 RepID=UPI0018859546|nr:probable glutamate--tRNA ligase, mitochondrial [Pollicipes pollicipes]
MPNCLSVQLVTSGLSQLAVRYLRTSAICQNVRTRFAPSPTGDLHLGSLRSALYNYLFARSHGGTFVLRIEDTDRSRTVPGATDRLLSTLQTMGLCPDEGPSVGGARGPYVQSERTALYQEHAEQLVASGAAYRCFCSRGRLDLLRRKAVSRAEKPRYDNRCRHLTDDKRRHLLERGVKHVVRLKLEDTAAPFPDLVYGPVAFDVAAQEGDPVLLKADGFPTYHLASVVDDRMMGVTHVLRGVEWQVSTSKHLVLYRAFGWEPPQFAHLPLITNPDGTKLSKRHSDVSVESHLARGFQPEALLNYVCLTGGGFRQLEQTALTDLTHLIEQFDLSRVHTNSCRLDPHRLHHLNQLALRRRFSSPGPRAELFETVRQLVTGRFKDSDHAVSQRVLEDQYVEKVLAWALEEGRVTTLQELVGRDLAYLWAVPGCLPVGRLPAVADPGGALRLTAAELAAWPEEDLTRERLVPLLRAVSERSQVKFGALMRLLRLALSGVEEGPGSRR